MQCFHPNRFGIGLLLPAHDGAHHQITGYQEEKFHSKGTSREGGNIKTQKVPGMLEYYHYGKIKPKKFNFSVFLI